jgi:O-antigen/teichoic acid export membrane protein
MLTYVHANRSDGGEGLQINRNIVANYSSRLWAGISTFIFIPLYMRILGPEAFGLIALSTTILGIMFLIDMGLSNTFAREMARKPEKQTLANLLRSIEWLYAGIILLCLVLAFAGSDLISQHWLNASDLSPRRVRWSVALMLVSAAVQVMQSVYIGGLLGSNRHVTAAVYQIGFGVTRSGVVLVPLYFFPYVEFVFAWQLATAAIFVLLLRRTIWRIIAPSGRPRFSRSALLEVKAFAGGMFGILIISAINTQSDKLVVSKVFPLEELGAYAIAGLVGQIPSTVALPLAITVLPRLTELVERGNRANLVSLYMRYSHMISVVAFTAALGILAGAPEILSLLIGKAPTAELTMVCRVLTVGGAMLAVQFMPYHLAVASGHTRTSLAFGTISAILMPISVFVCARQLGLVGAAIPWLMMNLIAAIYLAGRITPRFLGPHIVEWVLRANLLPLAVASAAVAPAAISSQWPQHPISFLGWLALACCASIAINTYLSIRLFHHTSTAEYGRKEVP